MRRVFAGERPDVRQTEGSELLGDVVSDSRSSSSRTQLDVLRYLLGAGCPFVIFGGFAIRLYGMVRVVRDLDLFVGRDARTASCVARFLAPWREESEAELAEVLQRKILTWNDVQFFTGIQDLAFDSAYSRATLAEVGGVSVRLMAVSDLVAMKRFAVVSREDPSERAQDEADLAWLEALVP